MSFCSNCGAQLSEGAKFCANCGTAVAVSESIHQNCGAVIEGDHILISEPMPDNPDKQIVLWFPLDGGIYLKLEYNNREKTVGGWELNVENYDSDTGLLSGPLLATDENRNPVKGYVAVLIPNENGEKSYRYLERADYDWANTTLDTKEKFLASLEPSTAITLWDLKDYLEKFKKL